MSGYNNQSGSFDDDEFERQDGTNGGGLRRQLESVLEEVKTLRAELAKRDQKDAAEVLKDNGLDPAIKELIPEGADPAEWVEKYAHLLGVKGTERDIEPAPSDEAQLQLPEEDEDPAITLEREALSQIQGAAAAGSPAHIAGDVLERMDKIDSEDELMAFFNRNGAPLEG